MEQREPGGCLDEDAISRFLGCTLAPEDQEFAAQHVLTCEVCRTKLTDLAHERAPEPQNYSSVLLDEEGTGFAPSADSESGGLSPGTSLGRYVILAKVGAGGMGIVYSAYDPELNRQIAIKVIRTEILRDSERAHASLRDEARAMAQLTHPNVVRVYDVGTQGQLVYIAMEFIDGEDLRQFAKRQHELGAWRPIFDACLQAGRGLQAAHEAGLVHRDFKPSNVLVSKDGRAFVADFGLTRLFSKSPTGGEVGWTSASGTRGYAAPEQLAGKRCDARSDQYSFCVAVAECLFERDPSSIFRRVSYDKKQRTAGPRRLGPLLERGLSKENAERHESMEVLLDKLQSRANRRRRTATVAASVTALGSIGILMFALGSRTSTTSNTCAAGAERFHKLWNDDRSQALGVALASTRFGKQASFFIETAGGLASELANEQVSSCAATYKSNAQSSELFDRQMFCLNSHATELDAIISMVEGGASVETGQSALGSMASVAECRVSESLLATQTPPSDPQSLQKIQSVEDKLAKRRGLEEDGKALEALETVQQAIVEAEAIGYGPLITRAEVIQAEILEGLERYAEARKAAERARDAAAKGRDTRRLVIALLRLASIVSTYEDDVDEANAYLTTARSLSLGIELPAVDLLNIELTSGALAQASGDFDRAIGYADTGLKMLSSAANGEQDADFRNAEIGLLHVVAAAQFAKNNLYEAEAQLRTIHALETERLGPDHSDLAVSLVNIATVDYKLGKLDEALELLGRAREILADTDARLTDLGQALTLQALIQNQKGNLSEAVSVYEQTIDVYRKVYGDDHANIWRTKANLANTLLALQRWDEALEIQRGFLTWTIERYGAESPTAVAAKLNLASTLVQVHFEDGEVQDAQQLLGELANDLAPDDGTLVGVRAMQGNAFLARKQYAEAVSAFEESLKLAAVTPNSEASFPATTTAALAEVLWLAGKQRRAIAVGNDALELFDALDPSMAQGRAALATWVAEKEAELAGARP